MHNFSVKVVPQQKTVHPPQKTVHPPWKTVHPPICDGKHYDTDTDWTLHVNTNTDSDSLSLHTPQDHAVARRRLLLWSSSHQYHHQEYNIFRLIALNNDFDGRSQNTRIKEHFLHFLSLKLTWVFEGKI